MKIINNLPQKTDIRKQIGNLSHMKTILNNNLVGAINCLAANQEDLLQKIYPVGSIYMSVNPVSPSVFPGRTWVQIRDRFLPGAGNTYANGATGGEASHVSTAADMPGHQHRYTYYTIYYTILL